MGERLVAIGAWVSLLASAVLVGRLLVIDKPGVIVILLPAVFGALLALRNRRQPATLAVAALLTAATVVISLIGGVGLLYVPSVALYLVAAVQARSSTPQRHAT